MKPLESAEINRRNGLADECREMKLRRYINSLRPEQTYRFDDVWSLASPYWYSNEKYFSPIKRIYAHALGYFFDYLVSWLRDSYAKNTSIWNEVTFFFTIVATKFKGAFKGFGKKNEKKKKRNDHRWEPSRRLRKRIARSVRAASRIHLNADRHFPWASWNIRRPEIASKSSAVVLHGSKASSKCIFHSS